VGIFLSVLSQLTVGIFLPVLSQLTVGIFLPVVSVSYFLSYSQFINGVIIMNIRVLLPQYIVHYLVIKINWIGCVSALTTRKAQSLRSGQTININNL
jgi:hypothetical protein